MSVPDYPVVVRPLPAEDGGGYLAFAPDLPGCLSDGETGIEALENAHDAIQAWIERAKAMGRDPERSKKTFA
jgi:antitoxin HicB